MPAAQTLGADDYKVLQSMLVSDDASVRAEGQGLAKKLNAAEQVEFFNFQRQSRKGRDEQSQRADSAIVGGVPVVGSVNPEDALMAGVAGRAIKGAMSAVPDVAGKAVAGAKAVAAIASPAVKYEATKFVLQRMGVPGPIATGAAIAISGYRRGGAAPTAAPAAAAEEATVAARPAASSVSAESPIELTRRLKAENQARLAASAPPETVAGGTPPPVDSPPVSAPAAPPKSPQQVLNEEALARRRAEYQARVAAEAEATAAAPAKAKLTAAEAKEYMRLRTLGKTDEQAKEAILASRAMNAQFGLSVPTDAQTQFPKGMRGKPRTDR